ncbi:positive control sigma-like factor [compost metagenome]
MRQQIAGLMRKRVLQTQSLDTMPIEFFGSTSQPEISHKEIMELYHAALDKMPQQRKKIFLMSREEAMSNAQIAEKMGLSIHTVNNHIKASLKGLKKEFNDNPEIVGYVLAFSPSVLMVI